MNSHIVVQSDRTVIVPDELKEIAVQFDHNMRTVSFDCPRYWDGNDLSTMQAFINYIRPDGVAGQYECKTVDIDLDDENIIHFDWTITDNATHAAGRLLFLVCIQDADENGTPIKRWNSNPSSDMFVKSGIGASDEIACSNPDVILSLLTRFDSLKASAISETLADYLADNPSIGVINDWMMDESGYLYLLYGRKVVVGPIGPFQASGGGGGGSTFAVTITNLSESRVITVAEGESVLLRFNYSSVDDEGMDDGPGIGQVLVGGVVRQTFSATQGDHEIDITNYLSAGTNNVSVRITNSENTSKMLAYTVTVAAVYLASSFDASVPYSGVIPFVYTPTGLAEKTMHFELDGSEIGTVVVSTSGRQQNYPIAAQSHGSHILRVWFTCDIGGATISSNVLYYNLICTVAGNNTPIIAVTSPPLTGVEQYSNIVKKYRVYNPSSLTSAITLEVDGEAVANLTVDRTEQTWTYRAETVGEVTQTIRCGDIHVSWTQNVTESSIQVGAETEALALYLSSYGRSNNEANPGVWESEGVSVEFQNFNFVSDGWVQDEDNITVMRVTGDARLNIPYKMFAYDFRTTGKTLEFELATRDVLNYDAEVMTCYSGERGFKITAQQLRLASEQSELGTRYKEDEHIRVSFVAEKKSENRLLLCYINGIMSGAVQYPEDDDFSQTIPVGITVGSNDCTTDIYTIRAYDNSLTRYQILGNWVADTQNAQERLERYTRNDVYDAYGQVVISKLPTDLPYLVIQSTDLPQFKGDKKTCSGYFTDPTHPERSYSFVDAQIDVQGTSSQYYYRKNYKLKYKNGFILFDGSTTDTYQMNDKAVPTDTFTMKADVASSEGAFNVVLSMLYNDLCPYKTPAQEADPKVRQCIEGFPIVIFWDNGSEVKFLGKYNFNNDKGTEEVFGFRSGDESWETLQNGTARVGWHSADFSGNGWKTDFEARYPEDNTNITRLKALAEWLVSTDTDQATGAEITPVVYDGVEYTTDTKEYRLAKFSAELADHFIEDAVVFYYLFTEMFLSIDQREKNAFPTYLKDADRWIVLFYDADSSCGTDNKGNLAFDYYLEDIDYTEGGDPVYNGQNSVLFKNIRATRYDKVMEMYQHLRTSKQVSYEVVNDKFEAHQSKWPEAIFNEDMHTKCLEPLILDGDGLYLPMLQGKKEQWMKWWLYNRFRYLDSKYITGTSMTNRITIRAHQKANVFLTSYVNMYGHVYFNAAMVEHRMTRGQEYEFEWPASGAEDPVIGINDADLLTSLGDLSPLMVELIDVSGAPHISYLKLGDGAEGYANHSLTSVTLGNNVLLRHLDIRNCPNLTIVPDVSGCTNIEEIYCEGSAITGIKLPSGGILKTLHLPSTVVSLQVINQPQLTDFVLPSYSQLTTLRLENAGVLSNAALDILNAMPTNSRVRILGLNILECTVEEALALYDRLDTMRGLDENGNNMDKPQVSGTIFIPTLTSEELYSLHSRYPDITIIYTNLVLYTVNFWNGDTLLQTVENVSYLDSVEYTGDTPIKDGETDHSKWTFNGWNPEPSAVTGDMDCYAQFKFTGSFARELIQRTIEGNYENDRVTSIGVKVFAGVTGITSASFQAITHADSIPTSATSFYAPNLKTVSAYVFSDSQATIIDLPSLEEMGYSAFDRLAAARVILPSVRGTSGWGFAECGNLEFVDLGPNCMSVSDFCYCGKLVTFILRAEEVARLENVGSFNGTPIASGTGFIYVPRALVDSYKAATNWSTYANQIRAIEDYSEICGGEA